jgi:hypothetical protein
VSPPARSTHPLALLGWILGACARPAAPVVTEVAVLDAAASSPVARDADVPDVPVVPGDASAIGPPAAAPPSWVTFDGPPFVDETPMHGGPAWHIFGMKLPARVHSSGAIVLAVEHERGLSSVPNLAVRFLSKDGSHVDRTVDLLTESEFDQALTREKKSSFAALGDVVRGRVAALNAELDARGADVVPLDTCTIDPADGYSSSPACSATQTIRCGTTTFHYLGGRQTLESSHGRRSFPSWRKPAVKTTDGPSVHVNECIGGAWLDADAKMLTLSVVNLCAFAGDWCFVESDWRFVGVGR